MDAKDIRILRELSKNYDRSISEMGKRIGIFSPSVIRRRIKNLKKSNIIKKFLTDIDYELTGFNFITIIFVNYLTLKL